ncbi:hypothetical protein L798_07776 [Zootermopsis nevadensis]|uniref:Uncharacterized protein n=1 Tax=Zootermopsis nevadensis TaxID=136037 RepID=A0A067R6T0_ZOONE|nr:hypothetical protein L798_07776 [Zootermopsis nevadensis]
MVLKEHLTVMAVVCLVANGVHESIASRIDKMQSELREAAYRICAEDEVAGAMGLINHLAKACFVQGSANERIQTIVRSKGESAMLSACIDTALDEESAILSARERGFTMQRQNKGPEVAIRVIGSNLNAFKGLSRGTRFANRDMNHRIVHPGRGIDTEASRNAGFNAHMVTGSTDPRVVRRPSHFNVS